MSTKIADNFGRQLILDNGYDYAHALGHGIGTNSIHWFAPKTTLYICLVELKTTLIIYY